VIDAMLTGAEGRAESSVAPAMLAQMPIQRAITVCAEKRYDSRGFVKEARMLNMVPYVAQNDRKRSSSIDARATRYTSHITSQAKRKDLRACDNCAQPGANHQPPLNRGATIRKRSERESSIRMNPVGPRTRRSRSAKCPPIVQVSAT